MSKYSEAGKGSTNKLKQKKLYDENYERIWGSKSNKLYEDKYYDSDDSSNTWDEDRMDIIGVNGNTGDHYIKWLFINVMLNGLYQELIEDMSKCEYPIKVKDNMIKFWLIEDHGFGMKLIGIEGMKMYNILYTCFHSSYWFI